MLIKPPSLAEEPAAGTGQALVSIGPRAEGERTLMPAGDFESFAYLLTFSSGDLTVGPVKVTSAGGQGERIKKGVKKG